MAENRDRYQRGRNEGKDHRRDDRRPRFDDRPKHGNDRELLELLRGIDRASYGAYKRVLGHWNFGGFTVHIDRIQADPYAPPSAVRVTAKTATMGLPPEALSTSEQRLATGDFLTRRFAAALKRNKHYGAVSIAGAGQEILLRSAAHISEELVELRIQVRLPAQGRTIMGQQAAAIFDVELPDAVGEVFDFTTGTAAPYRAELIEHVHAYEDHCALTRTLVEKKWVGFVADQSILARRSGISDVPMSESVLFESPDSLRQEVTLPHAGKVVGMAIPQGITVIVGGGYHGKSTVLSALQRGVYPHIPGDGRELVATLPKAIKIRATDGRPITRVDLSAFINHLPTATDTTRFSTQNASGSTSQAAAIIEAVEVGSPLLLIDEDTSATNLMIRDERMRDLVSSSQEPITPLVDRIRGLYQDRGVSVVMVMGGSGDYLDVADLVLHMDAYHCLDVTDRAREIVAQKPRLSEDDDGFPSIAPRVPLRLRAGGDKQKTKSSGLDRIDLDRQTISVADVEQIVDPGQTEAIAWAVRGLLQTQADARRSLAELLDELEKTLDEKGLDALTSFGARKGPAFLVRPRMVDVAAAINRYRTLEIV